MSKNVVITGCRPRTLRPPHPGPVDSLAPAHSALAGLWLRPMELRATGAGFEDEDENEDEEEAGERGKYSPKFKVQSSKSGKSNGK